MQFAFYTGHPFFYDLFWTSKYVFPTREELLILMKFAQLKGNFNLDEN